jgi:hypothetical protein
MKIGQLNQNLKDGTVISLVSYLGRKHCDRTSAIVCFVAAVDRSGRQLLPSTVLGDILGAVV